MEKITEVLCNNIKTLRSKRGWTQSELSLSSGVSVETIKKIETGRVWPGLETIAAISLAFKVPETDLFSVNPGQNLQDIQDKYSLFTIIDKLEPRLLRTLLGITKNLLHGSGEESPRLKKRDK